MPLYTALPTEIVRAYQAGKPDANGQVPERSISDRDGTPCRHCLKTIPSGHEMLILAHCPFPAAQPYAEIGPIFLCAAPCERAVETELPEILTTSPDYLIKGYSALDRIIYGTGKVVSQADLAAEAAKILARADVAYAHVRSARNNCYQCRIDRDT